MCPCMHISKYKHIVISLVPDIVLGDCRAYWERYGSSLGFKKRWVQISKSYRLYSDQYEKSAFKPSIQNDKLWLLYFLYPRFFIDAHP